MLAVTLLAFAPLVLSGKAGNRPFGIITDHATFASYEYDYIVVGGGTAGLVVANRLSANPAYTVGVIEAGLHLPDEPLINIPFLFGQSVSDPKLDWLLATTPQPGLHNRSLIQPRGKVLGGSSALTYHNHNRGSAPEYDAWAALGNPGWDWAGMYPYFTKADTVTPGDPGFLPGIISRPGIFNAEDGARQGPLQISYNGNVSFITPYVGLFHESFTSLGAYSNPDPDGGNATGITLTARTVNLETGNRTYATNGYIEPVLNRQNLLVLTGAEATKILFANSTGTNTTLVANGIKYGNPNDTRQYTAKVNREVILSAGAFKTPQLLELSGIGNQTLLESLGIETLLDIPEVGENLQDHLEFNMDYLLKEDLPYDTWDIIRNNATRQAQAWLQYVNKHTGIYSASPATLAFFPLQPFPEEFNVTSLVDTLDKEIAAATLTPIRKKQFESQRQQLLDGSVTQVELAFVPKGGVAHSNEPLLEGRSYFTVVTFLYRPWSSGNVHINTTDPFAAPLIDPRYNEFTFDWEVAARWNQFSRKIMETEPISQFIERPNQPGANTTSLEDWDDFSREWCISVWHPVGSTSMAPREIGGVLDPKLVVYGTSNLRVVDAGAMPINVAAHTAATVYAMAEKASDIILSDRRAHSLTAAIKKL
ncbi:L-sorbose 1-dehydrogenase [Hypsizygus marmoreus]|uniref:L-sorbose 1-dehydrogenase n=1 Tax=Hypsizygus marmoreus TaxID=39966 RepID=A0A369K4Z2_HYPMA|nr:L-sorbose 1-dehydrogenase [Hypsizygus marmoreus]